MIKASHLSKIYGDRIAAKDISFEIENGTICGFLGPNGAGKSTTMNMLTGYLTPASGTVLVNDIDMFKNPGKAKKMIGYLPEIPPLYMDMTVREYLLFASRIKGIPKAEIPGEIDRVAAKTGVADVLDRLIMNLSKGYKQRTGFAQALLGDPEILILDEPTVGLDPKQIVEIRNLIKELGEKHTVILSTHILSEVSMICDDVVIISHGRVMASGNADELVESYNRIQNMKLVLKANATQAQMLLEDIEDIDSKKILSEEDGVTVIEVIAKKDKDIREVIAGKMSENNITVLEQSVSRVTLEDVYLKLTSEDHYREFLLEEGIITSNLKKDDALNIINIDEAKEK